MGSLRESPCVFINGEGSDHANLEIESLGFDLSLG
jgi:hypothetical protein